MKSKNKSSKFKQLAETRVNRALKDLDLISNLSNKSYYEYDDKDVSKIISTLENAIRSVKASFKKNIDRKKEFKL